MQTTTILLIEHARHRLDKLAEALQNSGFNVERDRSDAQQTQAIQAQAIQLIVLDLRRTHALSLCRKLRRTSQADVIPMLCLGAGDSHSGFAQSVLEAGADRFCARTQPIEQLVQQIILYTGKPTPAQTLEANTHDTPSWLDATAKSTMQPEMHAQAALARVLEQSLSAPLPDTMQTYAPYDDPDAYDREYIRHMHQRMQIQDYFSLLDVDAQAPWPVLYAALQRTEHALEPERFSPALRHEAQSSLQNIEQILKEARFVLSDPLRCLQYRTHMQPTLGSATTLPQHGHPVRHSRQQQAG